MAVLLLRSLGTVVPSAISRMPNVVVATKYVDGDWDVIVRWGSVVPAEARVHTLNARSAILRARSSDARHTAWTINRVPHGKSGVYTARILRSGGRSSGTTVFRAGHGRDMRIRVHVFNFEILGIERGGALVGSGTFGRFTLQAIVDVARRAIYSLGLHFGAVDILVKGPRMPVVRGVFTAPRLGPTVARRYAKAIQATVEAVNQVKRANQIGGTLPVVIGADPEFILRHKKTGRLVMASRYVRYRGRVGCDWQRSRSGRGRPIAELRIRPSSSPLEVAADVHRTLLHAARVLPTKRTSWLAGTLPKSGYPIGGHIHFSGVPVSTELVKALDNCLGLTTVLLENPKEARSRRLRHGFLGDVRCKPHGGFEYRTPASWLVSPEVTCGVLALASVVASEYFRISATPLSDPKFQRAFYKVDRETLLPLFDQMWSEIMQTNQGRIFAAQLQPLRDMIRSGQTWATGDFKPRWGI